jgi:hypothetical protein
MRHTPLALIPVLLLQGCTIVSTRTLPLTATPAATTAPVAADAEAVSVPVLQRLEAIPGEAGPTVNRWQIIAEAADRAGTPSYHWSASGGTLSATAGTRTWWLPPGEAGTHLVQVLVSSPTGGARTGTLALVVDDEGRSTMGAPVFRVVTDPASGSLLAPAPSVNTSFRQPVWYQVTQPGPTLRIEPGEALQALAWRQEGTGYRIDRTVDGGGHWVGGATASAMPIAAGHDAAGWWMQEEGSARLRSTDGLRWAAAKTGLSVATVAARRFRMTGQVLERREASGAWVPVARVPLEDRYLTLHDVLAVHERGPRTVIECAGGPMVQDGERPWRPVALPVPAGDTWLRLVLGTDGTAWALSRFGKLAILPREMR